MSEEVYKLKTAVMMIVFNRPDTTKEVFEEIRKARPSRFYLVSDAPRKGRPDDIDKVKECREYVESHIDWPCEFKKNYAEENMGCKERMHTGISWVLSQEPHTIILEDDVVPAPEFFRYCDELLEMYKNDKKVMMISGTNLLKGQRIKGTYTFSCFSDIWGWATWARAWKYYDPDVKTWPQVKRKGELKKVQNGLAYIFIKKNVNSVYTHKKDTWDIQWDYCRHIHGGLGIVPAVNMIRNIGFDREDATHTNGSCDEDFSYGKMRFPMKKRKVICRDTDYDRAYIKKYYGTKKIMEVLKRKLHII